jgi:outer membrane immunogenic protein
LPHGATAADLPVKAPAAPQAAPDSWTGFYVGASVGGRWTKADFSILAIDEFFIGGVQNDLPFCTSNVPPCATRSSFDASSIRTGVHAGYNFQLNARWLVGVEGDWAWADATASSGAAFKYFQAVPGFQPDSSIALKTTWDAGVRARIGFLASPDLLVYATGGAAWMHSELTSTCGGTSCFPATYAPSVLSSTVNWTGWTVGAGVEDRLSRHWTVRGEYRYADFGTKTFTDVRTCSPSPSPSCGIFTSLNVSYDLSVKTHTALVALSYLFD